MESRNPPLGELGDPEEIGEPQLPARLEVAVLVPCYNEERSIGQVVHDFKVHLPTARIYVYNNNSTDRTLQIAREAGAIARDEFNSGQG